MLTYTAKVCDLSTGMLMKRSPLGRIPDHPPSGTTLTRTLALEVRVGFAVKVVTLTYVVVNVVGLTDVSVNVVGLTYVVVSTIGCSPSCRG